VADKLLIKEVIMKKNSGFTLVELVIVIVILAVLTATVLPRFVNLEEKATDAVLKGALTSMKSAARIGNLYARTETPDAQGDIDIDGTDIYMVNGYPVARPAGNNSFLGLEELMEIDVEVTAVYSDPGGAATDDNVRANADDDSLILFLGGRCVTYTPPQNPGDDPSFSTTVLDYNAATQACS
jgi:MSHA pilin protein MshA